jgi:hypothetical protein
VDAFSAARALASASPRAPPPAPPPHPPAPPPPPPPPEAAYLAALGAAAPAGGSGDSSRSAALLEADWAWERARHARAQQQQQQQQLTATNPAGKAAAYATVDRGGALRPPHDYFVRVLYGGAPLPLPGAGAGGLLPLPVFRALLARRIPVDWVGECGGAPAGGGVGGLRGEAPAPPGAEPTVNTVEWPVADVLPLLTPQLEALLGGAAHPNSALSRARRA